MDLTERDHLLSLLIECIGPTAAAYAWARPLYVFGGLSPQELWHLGCHETVRRWVEESTGARLRSVTSPQP